MPNQPAVVDRRQFCRIGSLGLLGAALASPLGTLSARARTRVALVGTGIRGSTTWGVNLLRDAGELVEIVGLCDVNPDRVKVAQRWMGGGIPTFTDFDEIHGDGRYADDHAIVTGMALYRGEAVLVVGTSPPATTRSGSSTPSRGRPTACRASTTRARPSTPGSLWNASTRLTAHS